MVDWSKQFNSSLSNGSAYDGKEDGPAADEVDEDEDLLPPVSANFSFLRLLDDDVGHVGQHLKSRSLVETRPFCSRTQLWGLWHSRTRAWWTFSSLFVPNAPWKGIVRDILAFSLECNNSSGTVLASVKLAIEETHQQASAYLVLPLWWKAVTPIFTDYDTKFFQNPHFF